MEIYRNSSFISNHIISYKSVLLEFYFFQAVVAYPAEPFSTENKQLQWLNESRLIYFIDKNSTSISDTPRCGFNNIKCPIKSSFDIFFESNPKHFFYIFQILFQYGVGS